MEEREKVISLKERKKHKNRIDLFKDKAKGSYLRNGVAYDIWEERMKAFAKKLRGIENPFVVMPRPRGEQQLQSDDHHKPFVVENDQVLQIVAQLRRIDSSF